jgi:hypothetical protein
MVSHPPTADTPIVNKPHVGDLNVLVITALWLQVSAIKKARSSAADRAKPIAGVFAPARHRAGRGKVMSTIVLHRHE